MAKLVHYRAQRGHGRRGKNDISPATAAHETFGVDSAKNEKVPNTSPIQRGYLASDRFYRYEAKAKVT